MARVLFVEPSIQLGRLHCDFLSRTGFTANHVLNSLQAVECLKAGPDIVCLTSSTSRNKRISSCLLAATRGIWKHTNCHAYYKRRSYSCSRTDWRTAFLAETSLHICLVCKNPECFCQDSADVVTFQEFSPITEIER